MSYSPKAQAKYDAKMAVYISLKLNRKTDADIIEALEASPNKQALIKKALRAHAIPDSWTGAWPASPTCPACGGTVDDEIVYMLDQHELPNYCPYCGKNLKGERMMKYHWNLESWGDAYPPENAADIIAAANEMIDAYAATHDEESTENYSEQLWDRYCTTGELIRGYIGKEKQGGRTV